MGVSSKDIFFNILKKRFEGKLVYKFVYSMPEMKNYSQLNHWTVYERVLKKIDDVVKLFDSATYIVKDDYLLINGFDSSGKLVGYISLQDKI